MTAHIPPGFSAVTPYLMVKDADAFLRFLAEALAAEELQVTRDDGVIAHAEMRVLGCVVEFSEARGEWPPTRSCFHCYVPSPESAVDRMIAHGATLTYAVTEHPYGERSGGVEDPWGNQWFLAAMTNEKARMPGRTT